MTLEQTIKGRYDALQAYEARIRAERDRKLEGAYNTEGYDRQLWDLRTQIKELQWVLQTMRDLEGGKIS